MQEFVILAFTLLTMNKMNCDIATAWEEPSVDGVAVLTNETFEAFAQKHPTFFVKFYAPWCGHCKKMAPDYSKLALLMAKEGGIPIAKVDATVEKELGQKYGVKGYPSLKLFKHGKPLDYKG